MAIDILISYANQKWTAYLIIRPHETWLVLKWVTLLRKNSGFFFVRHTIQNVLWITVVYPWIDLNLASFLFCAHES